MRAVKKMPPVDSPDGTRTVLPWRGLSFDSSYLALQALTPTHTTRTTAVRDCRGLFRKPLLIAPSHMDALYAPI